ncbi:MAG: UDP-N-acetylglucosamine 2-epimerase (non-hydrolyzing) [Ruminococcaceae bacterium]|nr:UDP-N-acetylglucosamine 2-epimerase (non-hydrolyzing) [Oscillospiraceae bacterium]
MKPVRVMSVFGTRPDAIKMCPLVLALEKDSRTESIVCLSAQHREMLDQVIRRFGVKPDYDLNIMKPRQTLYSITNDLLTGLEPVLAEAKPDIVLVHGDTSTCFVAALAAFYAKIPVGHVEAGLRTYDRYSPFPEEMNRCLVGRIATLHFAPTELNRENLAREGLTENVVITGNTVIDSMKYTVREDYRFENEVLASLDFSAGRYVLLTAHRRENLGEPLRNICRAARRLAAEYPDLHIIYPVHLNPAVREIVYAELGDVERIHLIEPTDVVDNHNLMAKCTFVMTDSGGIQEEATAVGVPTLVLRTETERPEGLSTGILRLVGVDENVIHDTAAKLLSDRDFYDAMAHAANPYGDGFASERIIDAIVAWKENN